MPLSPKGYLTERGCSYSFGLRKGKPMLLVSPAAICSRVGEISFISTAVVQTRTASKVPGRICLLPHQRHLVNGTGICLFGRSTVLWNYKLTGATFFS